MSSDPSIESLPRSPELPRERAQAMEALKRSAGAVRFMDHYATLIDEYGGDVLVGLIPGIGDASSTLASVITEMVQASRVGLPLTERLKIIMSQLLDLGIGATPVVGDIADYLYKSNVGARDRFFRHFETQLRDAWTRGVITRADARELAALSGTSITIPEEENAAPTRRAA